MADLTNHLTDYTNIANGTNIQFKSGTQAALNTMVTTGNAEEGTFYLTIDTHKLYIGRKSKTEKRTDSGHTDEYKVIPEQVSRGVTVVGTSAELPSFDSGNPNAPADAIEEGELFYVTDANILAALKWNTTTNKYQWVQINTPTGINSVNTSAVAAALNSPDVIVNTQIATAAGSKLGKTKFVAGNNVTLTPASTTITDSSVSYEVGVVTIAANDTTYSIGTDATPTSASAYSTSDAYDIGDIVKYNNKYYECNTAIATGGEAWTAAHWTEIKGGIIELRTNGNNSDAANSKILINGTNTVGVLSDADGNITVRGPAFSNLTFEGKTGSGNYGITATLNGTNGNTNTALTVSGDIDPQITYGLSGSKSTAHFQSSASGDPIIADLDVYTKAQADSAITTAINNQLATANAMTYKGIVTSASDLTTKVIANGGAHNGDVYKVGTVSTGFSVGEVNVQTGDLIILKGTEQAADAVAFPGQILIGGTGVTWDASANDGQGGYTVNSSFTTNALLGACELVPSGDEPKVVASTVAVENGSSTISSASRVELFDGKTGTSDSTNILTTRYVNGNMITINAAHKTGNNNDPDWVKSTGKDIALTFNHNTVSRTDSTTATLENNGTANAILTKAALNAVDTIGKDDTYELFVFSNPSTALTTDSYGHVTGLQGKKINFKHNRITSYTTEYGLNANNGLVSITSTDTIGATAIASFKIKSDTLSIVGDQTNHQLKVDLTWGTF